MQRNMKTIDAKTIENLDFRHYYFYDTDSEYTCEESGCNEEGICRCGRIVGLSVDRGQFEARYLLEEIPELQELTPVAEYCLDVYLRRDMGNLEFGYSSCGGYYGDELESVYIDSGAAELAEYCNYLLSDVSDLDKVKDILKREYGYLLPEVDGKSVEIKEVSFHNILPGNKKQLEKARKKSGLLAFEPEDICGVVIPNNNAGYRLIDGYHRYTKTEQWAKKCRGDYKVRVLVMYD